MNDNRPITPDQPINQIVPPDIKYDHKKAKYPANKPPPKPEPQPDSQQPTEGTSTFNDRPVGFGKGL